MKVLILSLLILFAALSTVSAGELQEEFSLGKPIAGRQAAWPGHVQYASWLDEQRIVYLSSQAGLNCISLETKRPLWTRPIAGNIQAFSVSRKSKLIAIYSDVESFDKHWLVVIDADTGVPVFEANKQQLALWLKHDSTNVSALALSPTEDRLLLIDYSRKFALCGSAFNPRNPQQMDTFHADASIFRLSLSADGKRMAYIASGSDGGQSEQQVLAVRDIQADRDIFVQGKRILKVPEQMSFSVDAPFYSHIRHDGENLLLVSRDNSWGKGQILLRDIKTSKQKSFGARNGHIELDVRFDLGRIALTGTSTDLAVLDLDGKLIAEKKQATTDRNDCVEFSPAGNRIIVGSWDNTVRIFRLVE